MQNYLTKVLHDLVHIFIVISEDISLCQRDMESYGTAFKQEGTKLVSIKDCFHTVEDRGKIFNMD